MINLTEKEIADFFENTYRVLDQSPETIAGLFPDSEYKLVNAKYGKDKVIEVSTKKFVLTCLINSNNECEGSYLFLNTDEELEMMKPILHYCNKTFAYNYLLKMWMMGCASIDLRIMDQSVLFAVSKIDPLPDKFRKYLFWEF